MGHVFDTPDLGHAGPRLNLLLSSPCRTALDSDSLEDPELNLLQQFLLLKSCLEEVYAARKQSVPRAVVGGFKAVCFCLGLQ